MSSKRYLTILAMTSALIAPCAAFATGPGALEFAQAPPPKEGEQPPSKVPPQKGPPQPLRKGPPTAPKAFAPQKPSAGPVPDKPSKGPAPAKPFAPKSAAPTAAPSPPPPKAFFKKKPPDNKPPENTAIPPKPALPPKAPPVGAKPAFKGRNIPEATPKIVKEPPAAPPKGAAGIAPGPKSLPKQPVPATRGPRFDASKRPPPAKAPQAKDLSQLKSARRQSTEAGGKRIVIVEPDRRRIIREDGRTFIRHDETERFRRQWRNTRYERRGGLEISVTVLPGGFTIYTEFDSDRRPLRRYRRGPDGRDIILFDNRAFYRRHRGPYWQRYAYVELPPPVIRIPRRQYIVEYDEASFDDIYDALYAPPLDELDRLYSLEEIRYSQSLRDRMRRVDLSSINFESGSWEIDESQYRKLERMADAINRIIERDSSEMFLIEGHTDATGDADDNLSLADRRAESVAIILTQEFGVPPENLITQGYGEENLKVPTDGPEPANRYVAVRRITPLLDR